MDFTNLSKKDENYDIRIDDNGVWWHEGAPIKRKALVKLFSTVLRYDSQKGEYWLVTPAEAGRIVVEDVPYIITDYIWGDDKIILINNLDKKIQINSQDQIVLEYAKKHKMMLPYVTMENGLKARFSRNVYYHLLNEADEEEGCFYITSEGEKIIIGQVDA